MKFQILRKAGALVLALVLALTLTVPAWAAGDDETETPVAVTGVTLNKTSLSLAVGGSETLTATVAPENATDRNVTWSSDNTVIAAVSNGTVTARSKGKANITVTTADGNKTATCEVTVTEPVKLQFSVSGDLLWSKNSGPLTVTAYLTGDVEEENPTITWGIANKSSDTTTPPTIPETTTGKTGTITIPTDSPGEFTVTAAYGDQMIAKNVTISGIILSGRTLEDGTLTMFEGGMTALSVKAYGSANNSTKVVWSSSNQSVVVVMDGTLTAYGLGKAVITAAKGDYSDDCTVEVVEDESVIAGPYTASVSKPLKLSEVLPELKTITEKKTAELSDGISSPLRYINNLKVSTSQGTLYYNYSSEGDTGSGVGTADQFGEKASGSIKSADKLFFVPKQGFVGTAEITFNAVAVSGQNFSGSIKVNVGMSSPSGEDGEDGEGDEYRYQISYRTKAGEPAWFQASDFRAFCQSATGRSYNSITFNLPKASEGTLYYNYMAGSGNPVTTTTKFTPAGVYTLDNVCFVPNAAFDGESVKISFHAVDSSGASVNGTVEVVVDPVDVSGDPSNVTIFGEQGQPVTLQSELFNDAAQDTINDTLSFVIFKLPDPREGVLYYNYRSDGSYDSRVTAATRYYYSGVPGINGVTFVPGSGASGRIAIPYTGYGSGGTSFAGTLYIGLDEADSSTIRYSVEKYGSVAFRASDFYNAGLYRKGIGVDYVTFTDVPGTDLGKLYYNYRSSSQSGSSVSGAYYVSPNYSWQWGLNLISFHAAGSTGTYTIPYTAVCGAGTSQQTMFSGEVVIQVGAVAAADVNISCNNREYAQMSSYSLSSACDPVMSQSLSYIEITSVPNPEEGHLYLNYYGFGTGTAVKPGDRFYCAGSPGIDQLTFVPYAGFTGEAEITYIGYGGDGQEQASGRVVVSVSQSRTSRYFNDMSNHVWAIDSVDYLYWNGTVKGVGGSRYNPAGTITKGDFTLMLIRAYGLTASGSASFNDVPAGSYYADAIRIAAVLGIAGGTDGYYNPKAALSRQDAMLMIFNALKASGRTVTNGLAADLSVYHDEGDIAPYAREAVGSLVQMGVVEGVGNGYLRPQRLLNRAETAKLLHAIMTL